MGHLAAPYIPFRASFLASSLVCFPRSPPSCGVELSSTRPELKEARPPDAARNPVIPRILSRRKSGEDGASDESQERVFVTSARVCLCCLQLDNASLQPARIGPVQECAEIAQW